MVPFVVVPLAGAVVDKHSGFPVAEVGSVVDPGVVGYSAVAVLVLVEPVAVVVLVLAEGLAAAPVVVQRV